LAGGVGGRPGLGGGVGGAPGLAGGVGGWPGVGGVGNIGIAKNRGYFNDWQNGNWNGNWGGAGSGYWNGWNDGCDSGFNSGYWNGGWGGYWNGGLGGYWGGPWYSNPIAWGLGAWALGSCMYDSGYASYSNPYYVDSGETAAYYDYSQPITVLNQQPPVMDATQSIAEASPSPEVQAGTSHMNLARAAFLAQNYADALREIDLAIQALPNDAALHEFRALVFFATKDYKSAAATLYAVLSAGPGWNWATLSGMYASTTTYTDQLRELEEYVNRNPAAPDARFVLAYHYLTCGHTAQAREQYEAVLKLHPGDQLSGQLLTLVSGSTEAPQNLKPKPLPPEPGASTAPTPPLDIDGSKLLGAWTAKRADGAVFSIELAPDDKFTWRFDQKGKKQQFDGKYSIDGAILLLERGDGAQMPGLVTLSDKGFNFKLYGGPPDDPGLDFKKGSRL
jgi:tetratricopeptide (TPR) repeat protein